jgi:hypothetical protein
MKGKPGQGNTGTPAANHSRSNPKASDRLLKGPSTGPPKGQRRSRTVDVDHRHFFYPALEDVPVKVSR